MNLSLRYTHTHAILEKRILDLYEGSLKTRTDITLCGLKIADMNELYWDDIEDGMRGFRSSADTNDIEFFDGPIKILLPDEYNELYNNVRKMITEELNLNRLVYTSYMIQLLWYLVYINKLPKDLEGLKEYYDDNHIEWPIKDPVVNKEPLTDLQAIETFASLLQSDNIEDKALALDIKIKLKEWR